MLPKLITEHQNRLSAVWQQAVHEIISRTSHPHYQIATELLHRYMQNPGKLIRPSLFLYGTNLLDVRNNSATTYDLAISLELLHVALLIQDDIMDNSSTRRGGSSLHVLFEQYHSQHGLMGSAHEFGTSMAMLLSDILINEAEKRWTKNCITNNGITALRNNFDQLKEEVYWGQYHDILLPHLGQLPTETEIKEIMVEKSGKYSIYYPLYIGALYGGIPKTDIDWLYDFGTQLGIAFQITDDILGIFGNEAMTGKSTKSDIAERKLTLLVRYAYDTCNKKDKHILEQFYITHQSIPTREIKIIIEQSQAREKVSIIAQAHYQNALAILKKTHLADGKKALLEEFANFIITRSK